MPLLILCLLLISCSDSQQAQPGTQQSGTPVAGFEVTETDLSRTVSSSGAVQALNIRMIGAPFSGIIESVYVEEGDEISAGDPIATYDLTEIEAELRRSEAQVREVRQRVDRMERLLDSDAISRSEFEDVQAELSVAEAEYEVWETRAELGKIKAKTDGVITERFIEPGSPVSANERLFKVDDIGTLVIRVAMSELDVIHVERGDTVEIRLDAYQGYSISGTVRRVFPSAEADSRRFPVEVEITGNDAMNIRPGFMARVYFDVDRRENTLAIPSEALLASQRGEQFIYKIENDTLVRADVDIGVARRNMTEITSGLESGDIIVGTNPTNLNEGTHVRITEWIE